MPTPPRDQFLDLPEGDPLSTEHLDEKVQQAEQQEQVLKRQLETIEKQKREFAELSRRQEALTTSKGDLSEKLDRALKVIERETMEAGKRLEMLQSVDSAFREHLETLGAINPKLWGESEIGTELTRAMASVEDARNEYNRAFPRVAAMPEQAASASSPETGYTADYSGGDGKDFIGWLKIGFAFSLPLIVLGLIALVVIASRMPAK
jgi:hypothetical protein